MRLWRLTRSAHAALDGSGPEKFGARWTSPGQPVVNFASEAGLAVLVALRYLPEDRAEWPYDFVLGFTDVDAEPVRLPFVDPDDEKRALGDEWLRSGRSLLAAVQSAVLPEADVVMMNPRHPEAQKVPPLTTRRFSFEECLHRPPMLDAYRGD